MDKDKPVIFKLHGPMHYDVQNVCFCVGPQNGEPLCPCRMRNVFIRDGRYIEREKDLGPVAKLGVAALQEGS